MLTQCVERCPEDLWIAANPATDQSAPWGGFERSFWRIAFHCAYFTHLYLGQGEDAFEPPGQEAMRRPEFDEMWHAPWSLEPYELPVGVEPSTRADILDYIGYVDGRVDPTVDGLDLDTAASGFSWYPRQTKLSHELLNLRHLQGHVGQLSELLMARGIDIDWR